jgi:hypothetical protein
MASDLRNDVGVIDAGHGDVFQSNVFWTIKRMVIMVRTNYMTGN